MAQKPKIQYIGQFYSLGSEAKALEIHKPVKKPKTKLPVARPEKIEIVYVDPVALAGIVIAIALLAAMAFGAVRIQNDWDDYEQMSSYTAQMRQKNLELTQKMRTLYDYEMVQSKAIGMGMIPQSEAEKTTVYVSVPVPEPEPTLIENILWFWHGLFA